MLASPFWRIASVLTDHRTVPCSADGDFSGTGYPSVSYNLEHISMLITANSQSFSASEQTSVSATAATTAGQSSDTGRLVNLANLIDIVVFGNLSEQERGRLESHFRGLNSEPDSGEALRQLRQQTEQQGIYPVLIFEDAPHGKPITLQRDRTARPGESIDLKGRANSQPLGEHVRENEIMGLIGRVADDLSRSQREHGQDRLADDPTRLNEPVVEGATRIGLYFYGKDLAWQPRPNQDHRMPSWDTP